MGTANDFSLPALRLDDRDTVPDLSANDSDSYEKIANDGSENASLENTDVQLINKKSTFSELIQGQQESDSDSIVKTNSEETEGSRTMLIEKVQRDVVAEETSNSNTASGIIFSPICVAKKSVAEQTAEGSTARDLSLSAEVVHCIPLLEGSSPSASFTVVQRDPDNVRTTITSTNADDSEPFNVGENKTASNKTGDNNIILGTPPLPPPISLLAPHSSPPYIGATSTSEDQSYQQPSSRAATMYPALEQPINENINVPQIVTTAPSTPVKLFPEPSTATIPLSSSSLNVITQHLLNNIGETFAAHQQQQQQTQIIYQQHHQQIIANGTPTPSSKRSIRLELVEDHKASEKPHKREGSILSSFSLRRSYRPRSGSFGSFNPLGASESAPKTQQGHSPVLVSKNNKSNSDRNSNSSQLQHPLSKEVSKGSITVSWYDGTTTAELQEHVRISIIRKLGKDVENIRLLDYGQEHPDDESTEVVLSPHIPSGSKFIVKYTPAPPPTPVRTVYKYGEQAPDSPSAALTPSPSVPNLNLDAADNAPIYRSISTSRRSIDFINGQQTGAIQEEIDGSHSAPSSPPLLPNAKGKTLSTTTTSISTSRGSVKEKVVVVQATQTQIKRHVIFMMANYFVLFLSIIAISAELHERAPKWMNEQLSQVHACAVDRDTLFECVSNGNISGLIASIALWMSKTKITSRIFLFGFRTRNELWTVVYESFVTSFCWGFSYLFIRRGLNPDTQQNFLGKYWKDCVYGSLAGFNAAFMKAVLKNLIPKEAVEEVFMETQQLSIINIIGRLFKHR